MTCARCRGLMVIDMSPHHISATYGAGIEMIRCLNCGNVEDAIIRTHRVRLHTPRPGESNSVGVNRSHTMDHNHHSTL